jgi:peptide/nickel transport system substrate-binding protein
VQSIPGTVRATRRAAVAVNMSIAAAFALAAATLGAGTAGAAAAAAAHKAAALHPIAGTFTQYLSIAPKTLDPAHMELASEDEVSNYLGASLVDVSPTGEIVPWLATSWKVSDGGKTYTFHLRSGIKFPLSGTALTAQVIAQTYTRDLSPATGSPVAASLLAGVKSVTAPNPSTVVFQLSAPNGPFLLNLASPGYLQPVDPTELKKWGSAYGQHPSSVGPYMLQSWVPGQSLTLVRNPDYTYAPSFDDPGAPYIKYLKFIIIPEQSSEVAAFASGEVDMLSVPTQDWSQYASNPTYQFVSGVAGTITYMDMNEERPMFQNVKVREAFAYAIDRAAFVKAVLDGHGLVAGGPYPPNLFGYDGALTRDFPYDPARAKKLMEQAGYTYNSAGQLTKNGKPIVLQFLNPGSTLTVMAQFIQANLQTIGIKTKITTLEYSTEAADMLAGKYDIAMNGYGWAEGDPITVMQIFLTPNGGADADHFNNPAFTALTDRYIDTTNQALRLRLITQVQQEFIKYLPFVPLTYGITGDAINKNYGGISWSSFYAGPFTDNMYEK